MQSGRKSKFGVSLEILSKIIVLEHANDNEKMPKI